MKRYLLFDSGCSVCDQIAQAIEEAAAGKLEAVSIDDARAREWLDQAYPGGWEHRPYLVTVEGDRLKASASTVMVLRLGLLLGPPKAWRVALLARRSGVPITGIDLERRRLLWSGGALLAGLTLFGLPKPGRLGPSMIAHAQAPLVGELYAGFLLLPDGAPVPPIVKYPERGIPIACGVGQDNMRPSAVSRFLETPTDLARVVPFPVYSLNEPPRGLRSTGAYLIRHETGEVFTASVNFESFQGTVSISAQPDFPRPFPLWSSDPVEPGGPAVILERVDFLPSPGIMVATRQGYVFHWIEQDVLYWLIAEDDPSREEAQALARSLVLIEG